MEEKSKFCITCKGSKQIEVIVMGTDTEMVECPYCSTKEEYKKFQEWIRKPFKTSDDDN